MKRARSHAALTMLLGLLVAACGGARASDGSAGAAPAGQASIGAPAGQANASASGAGPSAEAGPPVEGRGAAETHAPAGPASAKPPTLAPGSAPVEAGVQAPRAADRREASFDGPPFFRRPGEGRGPPPPGPDLGPPRTPEPAPSGPSAGPGPAPQGGGPCPDDMVFAGSVCVDRHEAFLVTLGEAGVEAVWPHHQRPRAGVAYVARNAAGSMPQAYVNRPEAEAACRLAGKRLCALAEWQRACHGKRQTLYPYGKAYVKGACNSGKPHLLSMFFGRDGYAWKYEEHFNSPLLDQQPGYLAKGGEYAACASDEGVHDLVGNLHEWVANAVDQIPFGPGHPGVPVRRRPMTRVGNGIFMGGFFSTTDEHGAGCTFITTAHEPAYHDYSVGFRCCRAPGPARGPG